MALYSTKSINRPNLVTILGAAAAALLMFVLLVLTSSSWHQAGAASLSFDAVADAQLSTQSPNKANGLDTKMAVCGQGTPVCSVDGVNEKRAIIKFNVTGVTTEVTGVKLRLYVTSKPVPVLQIKQLTASTWEEGTATWNNAANAETTSSVYMTQAGSNTGWYEVDVTGAVSSNGLVSFIVLSADSTTVRLATRETSTKPQLVLTTSDQTPEPPTDPEPPVPNQLNTYLGTTHVHTGANNDHGVDDSTTDEVFATAKSSGLNFIILTEHAGPTGPADGNAFYADAQTKADLYSETDRFVGLAGYEYSENGGDGDSDSGHMTGWGTTEYVNARASGMNFNSFYNLLIANQNIPRPVLAGFNHPASTGHGASSANLLTPERRELVVMSETSNKVGYNSTDEAAYYQGFVAELDRGWRVAPTCGLDTHGLTGLKQIETSTKKPCRTGLLASTLTKETLVDALKQRRIYSTRDTNMLISYKVNDKWMGSMVGVPATATFDITVSDPDTSTSADKIKKIEVIGNGGAVLASQTFDAHSVSWQPNVAVGSNKYMFIRIFNGERTAQTAVAAPVWFE
ncbi:MAG TPA: DNRLRE domain-containing protein [Candidatus Saccharibacteria bacterium]|nr:DNRLRE domain-containing protein [Candidatus Saccharibacteria bacterium]